MMRPNLDRALTVLNYSRQIYPLTTLFFFLVCFVAFSVFNAQDAADKVKVHGMRGPGGRPLPVRRKSANQLKEVTEVKDFTPRVKLFFIALQSLILMTFVINSVAIILQVIWYRDQQWWPGQSAVVYLVASFFTWLVVFITIIDTKPSPTWAHAIAWAIALPFELVVLGATIEIYSQPHHEPKVGDQFGGKLREEITAWEVIEILVYFVRIVMLLGAALLYVVARLMTRKANAPAAQIPGDQQPLLNGSAHDSGPNGHAYGTNGTPPTAPSKTGAAPTKTEQTDAWAKPTEAPNITWYAYLRGFLVLLPYLWPQKSRKLQALAMLCFLIMISQRVINVFVPIFTGMITDALGGKDGDGIRAPWLIIAAYISFRWLQGGQGILGASRSILWIPVEQYSYRAISTAAFEHVHNLSAEFHSGKRTGELISALNKGSSINSFLEMVTFNVGPMIFDLVVAIVYLTLKFDVYLGLVVAIVTFLYIYVTIRLAAWRVLLRRNYVTADREMEAVKNDSLHSWDTVKYFNAEDYEFNRYRKSIRTMQSLEYWVDVTLAIMNTVQGTLFMIALLVACFIEAYQVAQGYQSVGNYVVLITYMAQLQAPLNFFGTFYRSIQTNLINAERMLELFKAQPDVVDAPGAEDLIECNGSITFQNVTFAYDKRQNALNNLSFHCDAGKTTALVGESGGGKSTIMRLLYRYYNPSSGAILVDGRNVNEITINSLRKHTGVVPQDCNMFNETIMYNLKYANQNATDEEIYAACKAAAIHDRILQFTDGYQTAVGERGVKLSGGERQRVAIARTFLKDPKITLLDEATAALDTETEEKIQDAFRSLAQGRTMVIIAHRLSTIVDADQILVLNGGTVVERGTHAELMEQNGKYASMWRKQSRAQKAAAEAEELQSRARKALEAAEVDSTHVSEDEGGPGPSRGAGKGGKRMGHRRVNFSQSSLGRGVLNALDDDVTGGKPPGHP